MMPVRAVRRARGGTPPPVVEVVLVEGQDEGRDDDGGPDATGAGTRADGERTPLRHARRRPLVALGLVVLLVACLGVAATVVEERREAARLAHLADVPGVLPPLDGPPAERWRVAGWIATTVGELVLVADPSGAQLRAVELPRGEVRWTRDAPAGLPEQCGERPVDGATDLVLCASYGGVPAAADTVSTVAVVRTSDGTSVAERHLEGALLLREEHDGDQVLASVDHRSHVRVVRWDAAGDQDVWAWTSPRPVASDATVGIPVVEVRDDVVVVADVALDLATGAARPGVPPHEGADPHGGDPVLQELASGHRVVQTWRGGGVPGPVVVEAPDGTPLQELSGRLSPPWSVDDGSRPGLVLVETDGGLSGLDVTTGESRWTVDDVGFGETVALVDGLLVRQESDAAAATTHIVVRDADDGTVRWRRPSTGPAGWTDGRVVLAPEPSSAPPGGADLVRGYGRAPVDLVGRRLADGTEVWRVTLPPHDWLTVAEDGTVLLVGPEEVAGWR